MVLKESTRDYGYKNMNVKYGEKARVLKKLTKFSIIIWISYNNNNGYNKLYMNIRGWS